MKKIAFLGVLVIIGSLFNGASAATLADVKSAGTLRCGVNTGVAGFAFSESNTEWRGFDIALCRAIAAAVLGDSTAVTIVATTAEDRFGLLATGKIDVLVADTAWDISTDAEMRFTFAGITLYDGQGFMVRRDQQLTSATELDGRTICIEAGNTLAINLTDYFASNQMSFRPLMYKTNPEGLTHYLAGDCSVYTAAASVLAASRATFEFPGDHMILPEIISKEPLGVLVRQDDAHWADSVFWVLNALIAAEEMGITSANLETLAAGSENPEINRLLGNSGALGEMLGLDPQWARRAIAASGNYGEIFEANIGAATAIGLARGLNALWTQGGLMYARPFR